MAFNLDDVWANLDREMDANQRIMEKNFEASEQVIANIAACKALGGLDPLTVLAATAAEVAARNPFPEAKPTQETSP